MRLLPMIITSITLESDSKMAIGWQSIGGNTYYFRNWGGMITGKQVIDGKT